MRIVIHIATTVAALAALACAGERQTGDAAGIRTEFRDSAGIRIVENTRPPAGSRLDWRLGPEPLVSIGRMAGEDPYLFDRVLGAVVLSDGRILIGDAGTKELRVFDRNGGHLETWGGEGEGPGEFEAAASPYALALLPGDSIILWEFSYPELTVFGPDGELVRRFTPESSRWDFWDPASHLRPLDVSRNGLILAGQDDIFNDPMEVEVWDAAGEIRGSLGAHSGREAIRKGDDEPEPVMFGRYVRMQAWGDLFIIGTNHRYEFRAFALDGSLARIVRMDYALREPAEAHIEAYIAEDVSRIPDERADQRAETIRELRAMPVAEHLPAFAGIRGDDAMGHLWVYEYEAPGEETAGTLFTIFDPEGRLLGSFEMPEGMSILEIGVDYILGRVENELGVQSVQLWPLER